MEIAFTDSAQADLKAFVAVFFATTNDIAIRQTMALHDVEVRVINMAATAAIGTASARNF